MNESLSAEGITQIKTLLRHSVKLPIEPQPYAVEAAMECHTLYWQYAIHAMWNMQDSTHKIPAPRKKERDRAKIAGKWLAAVQELCFWVHDLALRSKIPIPFLNPTEWFQAILLELFAAGFQQISYLLYNVEETGPYRDPITPKGSINRKLMTKKREVRILSNVCHLAQRREISLERSHKYALGLLIALSVNFAEQYDGFRNQRYTPFIEAWKSLIDDFRQHWVCGEITDLDKPPLLQIGAGKQKGYLRKVRTRKMNN